MPENYHPHDPLGLEWTCERCGAVVAAEAFTELHSKWHDAFDSIRPALDAVGELSRVQTEALQHLLGGAK